MARNDWAGQEGVPKGGRSRTIPLTARLAEAVAAIRHLRGPRLLYFNDHPANALNLNRWMEAACQRAGLPPTQNFHRLRHTFGSHLAMQGAPAKVIQELMGHASLTQTSRYLHMARGAAEAAIALLEPAAGRQSGRKTPSVQRGTLQSR